MPIINEDDWDLLKCQKIQPFSGNFLPIAALIGRVDVTKRFSESSIARILDLVKHASRKKAATEKFITRFALRYTPIVVLLAISIALLPPLLNLDPPAGWVYRALILLVILCPCGLVTLNRSSIPLENKCNVSLLRQRRASFSECSFKGLSRANWE
ncbi:MAG TPA: hypothetical protein V6D19_09045 [Stenomitos sp.]